MLRNFDKGANRNKWPASPVVFSVLLNIGDRCLIFRASSNSKYLFGASHEPVCIVHTVKKCACCTRVERMINKRC